MRKMMLVVLCALSVVAHAEMKLGNPLIKKGLLYDVFYYDKDGNPQFLKQVYDSSAVSPNELSSLPFYLTTPVEILSQHLVVPTAVTTRTQWIKLRDDMAKKGTALWPVVTYHNGLNLALTGKLGIMFKKLVPQHIREEILNKYNLMVLEHLATDSDFYFTAMAPGTDPFAVANAIFKTGLAVWTQPDHYVSLQLTADPDPVTPNDTYFPNQKFYFDMMRAPLAWSITSGSPEVKVAVIDNGVDLAHEDLMANMHADLGYDFVDNDPDATYKILTGFTDVKMRTLDAHGTHVTGLIAAVGNNGKGITGLCWNCGIIPIRLIDFNAGTAGTPYRDTTMDIYRAFRWAVDQGAWVLNNSWGPNNTTCVDMPLNNYQEAGVNYAATKGRGGLGSVVVFAAGNNTCDLKFNPNLKNDHQLVVSALQYSGWMAPYSNYGDAIDFTAFAGMQGYGDQKTDGHITTDISYSGGCDEGHYAGIIKFTGTSAAAPVVAGGAALVLSANPKLTYQEAIFCLKKGASKAINNGLLQKCNIVRNGKLEEEYEWETQKDVFFSNEEMPHNNCFGFGILDIYESVRMARDGECTFSLPKCTKNEDCPEGNVCNLETGLCVMSTEEPEDPVYPDTTEVPDNNLPVDNAPQADTNPGNDNSPGSDIEEGSDTATGSDYSSPGNDVAGTVSDSDTGSGIGEYDDDLMLLEDSACGCTIVSQ